MFDSLARTLKAISWWLLALLVLALPVTSLPWLSDRMGGTLVSPPSVAFLALVCLTWLPLYFFSRGALPRETVPFVAFLAAVAVASALAFFINIPPYKGNRILSEEVSALLTLAIGAAIYFVFATWFRERAFLRWLLILLNLSGGLILLWSFAQLAVILFRAAEYPAWMVRIHDLVSIRSLADNVTRTRLVGFAYEPSWLAHQLNVLYLPFWLAASVTGYSSLRKVFRISVENVLLAGGMVVLVASFSRIGLLAFLLLITYLLLHTGLVLSRRLRSMLQRRAPAWLVSFLSAPVILVLLLAFFGVVVLGLLVFLSRYDPRIARLLDLGAIPTDLLAFAFQVDFAERVIYWLNGWLVFARYPLLGVGLGNAGFFFPEHVPVLGYRLNEVLAILTDFSFVPNVKNLWIRLLAETGLVGFSIFAAWLFVLWRAGSWLSGHPEPLYRAIGWMGLLAILSLVVEGFSVDSFALPYLWVSLGLLTAVSAMARRDHHRDPAASLPNGQGA